MLGQAMSLAMNALMVESSGIEPVWPDRFFPPDQEVVVDRSEDAAYPDRCHSGTYRPQLFLSWPKNPRSAAPAVLICPGGGYVKVCLDKEGFEIANWFNELGFAAAVLKYRLPPPHERPEVPVPIQDAVQAMSLLRKNAAQWGLDEKCIGIAGASAGGHLASMVATRFGEFSTEPGVRPDFQMLLYPVIRFHDSRSAHTGSCDALLGPDAKESLKRRFSSDLAVGPNTPPAFMVHSAEDPAVSVDNSESYGRALEEAGVRSQLLVLPTGGHGFGLGRKGGDPGTWPAVGARWLAETVRLKARATTFTV